MPRSSALWLTSTYHPQAPSDCSSPYNEPQKVSSEIGSMAGDSSCRSPARSQNWKYRKGLKLLDSAYVHATGAATTTVATRTACEARSMPDEMRRPR